MKCLRSALPLSLPFTSLSILCVCCTKQYTVFDSTWSTVRRTRTERVPKKSTQDSQTVHTPIVKNKICKTSLRLSITRTLVQIMRPGTPNQEKTIGQDEFHSQSHGKANSSQSFVWFVSRASLPYLVQQFTTWIPIFKKTYRKETRISWNSGILLQKSRRISIGT